MKTQCLAGRAITATAHCKKTGSEQSHARGSSRLNSPGRVSAMGGGIEQAVETYGYASLSCILPVRCPGSPHLCIHIYAHMHMHMYIWA